MILVHMFGFLRGFDLPWIWSRHGWRQKSNRVTGVGKCHKHAGKHLLLQHKTPLTKWRFCLTIPPVGCQV